MAIVEKSVDQTSPGRRAFYAVGKARFAIRAPIVRLYVEGPWNAELVTLTHKRLRADLDKLPRARWALLVSVSGSALCGADALEAIRNAAKAEHAETERVAAAWVLPPSVEGRMIMDEVIGNAYAGIHPIKVFETEADAEGWLATFFASA